MGKPDVTSSHFRSGANGLLFSLVFLQVLLVEGSIGFQIWLCVLPWTRQIKLRILGDLC